MDNLVFSNNKKVKDLEEGRVILVSDFKENIHLMKGAVEIGNEFYIKPARSLFAVCVLYKKDGKTHQIIYTFVSQTLTHNAWFVRGAWDHVLSTPEFKALNAKELNFWSDNCKGQFRNFQIVTYQVSSCEVHW